MRSTDLDRINDMESLLQAVCECERFSSAPGWSGDGSVEHAEYCPAGCVEYWISTHPMQAMAFASDHSAGRRPRPQLRAA